MENNKETLKHRAFNFSIKVIKFVEPLYVGGINKILFDQLIRSATSIGANIIEAQASSSRREFIKFYEISLKSANETIYWLEILKEVGKNPNETLGFLINEAKELANILGASLLTLKGKR